MRINRTFDQVYLKIISEENSIFPLDANLKKFLIEKFVYLINHKKTYEVISLYSLKDIISNSYIKEFIEQFCSNKIKVILKIDEKINSEGLFNVEALYVKNLSSMKVQLKKSIKEKLFNIRTSKRLLKNLIKKIYADQIDDLCSITINPKFITLDNSDLSRFTLEEVIEHEGQHLQTFLLSLAKDVYEICTWYSNNFSGFKSGEIEDEDYFLDEDEFITVFGSYNNILIRIIKSTSLSKINNKEILEFIKCLLSLIFNKPTNSKYVVPITSNKFYSRIKSFYLSIYNDKNFKFDQDINLILPKMKKSKWKQLLIWTYKNTVKNCKEN